MSASFEFPEWMAQAPPPDLSAVDPHQVEALVNDFIGAKQEALFTAPDAYTQQTAGDAVDGLPDILDRIDRLRIATLDKAGDEGTRTVLGPRLDAQMGEARDAIGRHAVREQDALNRRIVSERQTLIQRAAELEHDNDGKLGGLAEAGAGTAAELARLTGQPAEPAMADARSAVWRTAIGQHLARGNGAQALALYDRVHPHLSEPDRLSLDTPLQVVRDDREADAWLARNAGTDGPTVQERLDADPSLPAERKFLIRARVDERDAATASRRAATVQGLDDEARAAASILATRPAEYRPGAFARLADAYDAAGAPEKAAATRRIAASESALKSFARSSFAQQQATLATLPAGELRDNAEAIVAQQADAFARDPFAAGTALYTDEGRPAPIDDIPARVRQARVIAHRLGVPVPAYTADEIAGIRHTLANGSDQDKRTVLAHLDVVPVEHRPTPVSTPREVASDIPTTDDALHKDKVLLAQASPDHRDADMQARRIPAEQAPENSGGRGTAPLTEPPSNAPDFIKSLETWPGVPVALPNGKHIEDPGSPTGRVMAPFPRLESVAKAARRARTEILQAAAVNPTTAPTVIVDMLYNALKHNVGHGGDFDYQRQANKDQKGGYVQLRQFRNISNVNVGLFCQQLGLPRELALLIAGGYAYFKSSNAKVDNPYFLDADTKKYIDIGYDLGDSGVFD